MTEWGVFLVVSGLVTFIVAIGAPILKLNSSIVRLNVNMEKNNESLKNLTDDNKKEHEEIIRNNREDHKRLWNKLDDNRDRIDNHELRIQRIEDHNT